MVERLLKPSKSHSFFLFGNRGVGKSTYLRTLFPEPTSIWFDLLDPQIERRLALRPELLGQELDEASKKAPKGSFVVIDEIQKIPKILDVVHQHIEKKHFLFALTGSSARNLKKTGVNLLAGRAFVLNLYPFTHLELRKSFSLESVLQWGSLPKIFELDSMHKADFLMAYADTYLREEIVAEQLVRNIVPFRQFLEVAAQSNAKILNYQKIAHAVGVEIATVQNYFQILEDTFTGYLLQPFHESLRQRQRKNPKFYYFDLGLTRALQNRLTLQVVPQSFEYGDLFEQFIVLEAIRLNAYYKKSWRFSYLMTKDHVEVDLIIERPGKNKIFLEIKSASQTGSISEEKLRGFKNLVEQSPGTEGLVISQDPRARVDEGIRFLFWRDFFQEYLQD